MNYVKQNFNPKKHTIYEPLYPEKYKGSYPILCRSKWEESICKFLDLNDKVLIWGSEDIIIPYYDVTKRKNRKYYPDFICQIKEKTDKVVTYLVEVKPYKETQQPVGNINTKRYLKLDFSFHVLLLLHVFSLVMCMLFFHY